MDSGIKIWDPVSILESDPIFKGTYTDEIPMSRFVHELESKIEMATAIV